MEAGERADTEVWKRADTEVRPYQWPLPEMIFVNDAGKLFDGNYTPNCTPQLHPSADPAGGGRR
jgi:hypothetical protein